MMILKIEILKCSYYLRNQSQQTLSYCSSTFPSQPSQIFSLVNMRFIFQVHLRIRQLKRTRSSLIFVWPFCMMQELILASINCSSFSNFRILSSGLIDFGIRMFGLHCYISSNLHRQEFYQWSEGLMKISLANRRFQCTIFNFNVKRFLMMLSIDLQCLSLIG